MSSAAFMSRSEEPVELGKALDGAYILPQPVVNLPTEQAAGRRRIEQRRERRLRSRHDPFDHSWRNYRDARISAARGGVAFPLDPARLQGEVALGAVRGIGHEHEMPEVLFQGKAEQAREIVLAIHVGIDEQEGLGAE